MLRYACLILLVCSTTLHAEDKRPPNVLFIAVDDLNHWVGHLGRNKQTKTPNIDRLAARGVTFTRAYCAAPACNPSRAAIMTGMRPSTTGVYHNNQDWRPTISEDRCLTTAFKKSGYEVAGAGKIYHEAFRRREEWDDYLKNEGSNPVPTGNRGVGGIQFAPVDANDEDLNDFKIVDYGIDFLGQKHSKPFLLTIGLHKPHMPWNVPRKYYDLHPLDQIELPPHQADDLKDVPAAGVKVAKPDGDHAQILESGRWKEAIQGYLAAISYSDAMLGRLLDAFDKSEYAQNTVIVFWGDHGWHLGEKAHWRKFALWEEATRAPFIWVAPGVTHPGGVCNRTVDFMSIFPTLTDLTSIPTPSHVEGKSLRALLADPQAQWDQPALTTHGENNHAVRSEGWRYIRYADGSEELYDETADPYEWTNLAQKPESAERIKQLSAALPKINAPGVEAKAGGNGGQGGGNGAKAQQRKAKRAANSN
ncbi:MAG: sulfatase [Planctomycetota bacterium]